MTEQPTPPAPDSPAPASVTDFHIGEEFGTAKKTLPPARILLICIGAVAVVLAIYAFVARPKPQGAGSVDYVSATEVPDQGIVLAAVTVTLRNTGKKPLWIHSLKGQLITDDGKTLEDDTASGVELDRYAQAFPVLKENAQPPLLPETRIEPDAERRGTVVLSFPVTKPAFDSRKSIALIIQPSDQPVPIVLSK